MKTTLLGKGFAVEFDGVDLAALGDAALGELREIWMRNKVAVLRAALDDPQYDRYLLYRALLLTSTDLIVDPPGRTGSRGTIAPNCRKEAFRIWRPPTWCPTPNAS